MRYEKQLPVAFVELMRRLLGHDEATNLCQTLCTEPGTSIRLNPAKALAFTPTVAMENVPWCSCGYYLAERPPFTFDPLFHAGAYYVQEASSMFVAEILRQHLPLERSVVALDLCAAPGGKSTLLRSVLPEGSLLVCNEPMPKRAQVLAENMTKWGHPDVVVTQSMPEAFAALDGMFDVMLTDVPCSGEGMFRKDDEAVAEWSVENVDMCWHRQRDILADVWPALRPGGLLIYSTCTFNRSEDEDNVQWIADELGADILPVAVDESWGVVSGQNGLGYHFFPHRTRGEGFFCAALRKRGEGIRQELQSESAQDSKLKKIRLCTNVLQAGVTMGEDTKKGFVPSHALALTTAMRIRKDGCGMEPLNADYPRVDLTYDEAVAYLRGEVLRLHADVPRGYVIVTFRTLPLGFVKNIGSRANNMYPAAWRIRSTHIKQFSLL